MGITTEIVTMKIVSGLAKSEFEHIVNALEQDFHCKQDGFIDTELLYDEKSDEWIMIQHWESAERLKMASQKMFQVNETAAFVNALDRRSVKMKVLPQIKTWE